MLALTMLGIRASRLAMLQSLGGARLDKSHAHAPAAPAAAGGAPWKAGGQPVSTSHSTRHANNILPATDLIALKVEEQGAEGPPAALKQLQSELQVKDQASLKEVCAAMVLSECIYKAVDVGQERAEEAIQKLGSALPVNPGLFNVTWSPSGQRQRYIMAETVDALHVCFLGTKLGGDHLTNLNLRHHPVDLTSSSPSLSSSEPPSPAQQGDYSLRGGLLEEAGAGAGAAAHRGYALRAAGVPVEQMYRLAAVRGKRLVLSGHSLGGAVATLCTIRLLATLPPHLHHTVSCTGFATPPVGNARLVAAVGAAGLDERIANYVLPERSAKPADGHAKQALLMTWMGMALSMVTHHVISSTARLAHVALIVPRLLAPAYHHVGQQVFLRSVPAVLGCTHIGTSPRGSNLKHASTPAGTNQQQSGGWDGGGEVVGGWEYLALSNDPLLPLRVPGRSPLAMHRMISYRARVLDLWFTHHWQLQA